MKMQESLGGRQGQCVIKPGKGMGVAVWTVLLLVAIVRLGQAQSVPVYWPNEKGTDIREVELVERTVAYLQEALPDYLFRLVPLSKDNWVAELSSRDPGLIYGDPQQLLLLKSLERVRPVAGVECIYKGTSTRGSGGVLFALKASPVKTAADLSGRTIAAVRGGPMLSWIAVVRELREAHDMLPAEEAARIIQLEHDQYVVRSVFNGQADVGVVASSVLEGMAEEGQLDLDDVRVLPVAPVEALPDDTYPFLVSTRLYPNKRLMALARVSPEMIREVGAALLMADPAMMSPHQHLQTVWTVPHSCDEAQEALQVLQLPPYEDHQAMTLSTVMQQYMYWLIGAGVIFLLLGVSTSYVINLNRSLSEEIKDRKETQQSLRDSIERFAHVASCSGDWIWETDANEHFTYTSEALTDLLGWTPDQLIGKPFMTVLSNVEKEELEGVGRLFVGDQMFRRKLRLLTTDGRMVVHECVAGPIRDPRGRIIGYRGINRDVTGEARVVSFT